MKVSSCLILTFFSVCLLAVTASPHERQKTRILKNDDSLTRVVQRHRVVRQSDVRRTTTSYQWWRTPTTTSPWRRRTTTTSYPWWHWTTTYPWWHRTTTYPWWRSSTTKYPWWRKTTTYPWWPPTTVSTVQWWSEWNTWNSWSTWNNWNTWNSWHDWADGLHDRLSSDSAKTTNVGAIVGGVVGGVVLLALLIAAVVGISIFLTRNNRALRRARENNRTATVQNQSHQPMAPGSVQYTAPPAYTTAPVIQLGPHAYPYAGNPLYQIPFTNIQAVAQSESSVNEKQPIPGPNPDQPDPANANFNEVPPPYETAVSPSYEVPATRTEEDGDANLYTPVLPSVDTNENVYEVPK